VLKAVLFDLDDTLLGNPMDTFVPAYTRTIAQYVASHFQTDHFVEALMHGTAAMDANHGQGPTNEEAFAAVFYPEVGLERSVLEPLLKRFYAEEFDQLQPLTHSLPEARPLIHWVFEQGLQVAVATNSLFPQVAIEHRLAWAGIPIDDFDFDLVTSYEIMHATKASPKYYYEILSLLDRQPHECLMVGDDYLRDVGPASAAGIPVFWIAPPAATAPGAKTKPIGRGALSDAWNFLMTNCNYALATPTQPEGTPPRSGPGS